MSWANLGTIAPGFEWRDFPEPVVGGNLFRLTQSWDVGPGDAHLILASAPAQGGLYGFKTVYPTSEAIYLDMPVIPGLEIAGLITRYIELRWNPWARVAPGANWMVTLEHWIGA